MHPEDITIATFRREAERAIPNPTERAKAVAAFSSCKDAASRLACLRNLRGGSMTKNLSTKKTFAPDVR